MSRGIRVVCRDCGHEQTWNPSPDRLDSTPVHTHELVTGHRVAYEAAGERARGGAD